MALHASGKRVRKSSWFTACFFPSSSGAERGVAAGGDECVCVFVVVADYQRQDDADISLRAGERVEVIEKNDTGWWFVSTAEEQGWVPSSYLVCLTQEPNNYRAPKRDGRYVTLQAYKSSAGDGFGFECGVTVEVVQKKLEGWWFIRYEGKEGWAPASYLRKVQEDIGLPGNQTVAAETRRASVIGQVEIIGNLMEISNLTNRKRMNDTLSANYTHSGNSTDAESDTGDTDSDSSFSTKSDMTVNTQMTPNIHTDSGTRTDTHVCISADDANAGSTTRAGIIRPNTHSDVERNEYAKSIPDLHTHTDTAEMGPNTEGCVAGPDESVCELSLEVSVSSMQECNSDSVEGQVTSQRAYSKENTSPTFSQKRPPYREDGMGFGVPPAGSLASSSGHTEYYTIAEFSAGLRDGLSFHAGQKAEVLKKDKGGWWYVQTGGKEGWVPSSYIEKCNKTNTNRRVNTLTRPNVPPPAPPVKKQSVKSRKRSEVKTPHKKKAYEEPEYDVPAVSLYTEQECLPADAKGSPHTATCRPGQDSKKQGDEDQLVYEQGVGGRSTENTEERPSTSQFSCFGFQGPGWDPPVYDDPAVEPSVMFGPLHHSQGWFPEFRDHSERTVQHKTSPSDFPSLRRALPPSAPQKHTHCMSSNVPEGSETGGASSLGDSTAPCSPSFVLNSNDATLPQLYRSTAGFQQGAAGELSLPAGVLVQVLEKQKSGWWFVRWGTQEGWVPTYYLQHVTQSKADSDDRTDERLSVGLEKNEQRPRRATGVHQSPGVNGFGGGPVGRSRDGKDNTTVAKSYATASNEYSSVTKDKATQQDAALGLQWKNKSPNTFTSPCPRSASPQAGQGSSVSAAKPKPNLIYNNLGMEYISIADYYGNEESMGFSAGTRLEVLQRNSNGWWFCRTLDGSEARTGWVPSNFLQKRK